MFTNDICLLLSVLVKYFSLAWRLNVFAEDGFVDWSEGKTQELAEQKFVHLKRQR